MTDDRPRYMISIAAELVGMHPQTLRIYEAKGLVRPQRTGGNTRLYSEADLERLRAAKGLVRPQRTGGNTRLYSEADLERLRAIQRLTTELGLNLAGVERVLTLEEEMRRMHARLDRMSWA